MVEVLIIVAILGILCLEVIEILEKCQTPHAAAAQDARLDHLESSWRYTD